jgi:cytochrome c oxidase cbb3-type subunit 2
MPGYPWLAKNTLDGGDTPTKLKTLRTLGVPYTDVEIAAATEQVKGHTEMDALIEYLQTLKYHGSAVVTPK